MPIKRGMVIDNAEKIHVLNDNAFIFDRVRKNSPANAYSYFDYDLNEKKIKRPSVREKLKKFREIASAGLDKERVREKKLDKDKEASL